MNKNSPRTIFLSILALLCLAATSSRAQDSPRCESCAPVLRSCLQEGRPALRRCLHECRANSGSECPAGIDVEDCLDAEKLQACASVCRDARRGEIRRCVQSSLGCSNHCQPSPNPTATPTPKPDASES